MDTDNTAAVNFAFRALMLVGLLLYGLIAGGWAGLVAMGFVACFLTFGIGAVVADGWICSLWAAVKWFFYFLAFHFVLFCYSEPFLDAVMAFLGATISGVASLIQGVDDETRLGILFGMTLVGGLVWLLLRK